MVAQLVLNNQLRTADASVDENVLVDRVVEQAVQVGRFNNGVDMGDLIRTFGSSAGIVAIAGALRRGMKSGRLTAIGTTYYDSSLFR